MSNREIVRLNVGGLNYITTKSTLQKYPHSLLEAVFMKKRKISCCQETNLVTTLLNDADIFFNIFCRSVMPKLLLRHDQKMYKKTNTQYR